MPPYLYFVYRSADMSVYAVVNARRRYHPMLSGETDNITPVCRRMCRNASVHRVNITLCAVIICRMPTKNPTHVDAFGKKLLQTLRK